MPSVILVAVKAIEPSDKLQAVGLVFVPKVKTGAAGSLSDFEVVAVPVQPLFVIKKLLYPPEPSVPKVNAPPLTVTVLGEPVPV